MYSMIKNKTNAHYRRQNVVVQKHDRLQSTTIYYKMSVFVIRAELNIIGKRGLIKDIFSNKVEGNILSQG